MSVSPILSFLEGPELLIIAAIILVLFGGAKLPQLARSLGSAQREFKKGLNGDDDKGKNARQPELEQHQASNTERVARPRRRATRPERPSFAARHHSRS